MSLSEYIQHYFKMPDFLKFFVLAFLVLLLLYFTLFFYTKIKASGYRPSERREAVREGFASLSERLYALVFSGTSILFFMASYYMIERFLDVEPYRKMWDNYNDFLLLALMIVSCIFNSFLDRVLVRLKNLTREDRASVRLVAMLYMMAIFAYVKFIYENNNYDMFIMYFLGLMVGRFVYFDASFRDFLAALRGALANLPIMILTLLYTAVMSYWGFTSKYLLKHNGVITNVFFAHLFMCVCIFILHHLPVTRLLTGGPSKIGETFGDDEEDYEDDESEYDDFEYDESEYEDE